MKSVRITFVLALAALGCQDETHNTPDIDKGGQEEAIPPSDSRAGILGPEFKRGFAELVIDDGERHGMPTALVPYPDTYWPMIDDGINVEWIEKNGQRCKQVPTDDPGIKKKFGKDVTPDDPFDRVFLCSNARPSPLALYMSVLNPNQTKAAVKWEQENHGSKRTTNASWFGHCPGWVASTNLTKPLIGPAFARASANKSKFEACKKEEVGQNGCTKFEIGDINALSAEIHEGAQSKFIGNRCDKEQDQIQVDEFGRIVNKGCKGINFGALLIVLGNKFVATNDPKPVNINAQNPETTEQIWNQPAFGLTIHSMTPFTKEQAQKAVANGSAFTQFRGKTLDYKNINANAKGWALVDASVHWVKEIGPNLKSVSGLQGENETRMVGVVELDKPASDPTAQILGGELLDNPIVGANRLTNNPFMWIATDTSPDPTSNSSNARRNPFVKAAAVESLIDISHQQNGSADRGGRAGRRNDRGDAAPNCAQVRDTIIECLTNNNSPVTCVTELGGDGGLDAGIGILEACDFI